MGKWLASVPERENTVQGNLTIYPNISLKLSLMPFQYLTLFCNVSQLSMSNQFLLFLSISCTPPYLSASSFFLPFSSPLLLPLSESFKTQFFSLVLLNIFWIFLSYSDCLSQSLTKSQSLKSLFLNIFLEINSISVHNCQSFLICLFHLSIQFLVIHMLFFFVGISVFLLVLLMPQFCQSLNLSQFFSENFFFKISPSNPYSSFLFFSLSQKI